LISDWGLLIEAGSFRGAYEDRGELVGFVEQRLSQFLREQAGVDDQLEPEAGLVRLLNDDTSLAINSARDRPWQAAR
jgi:hypothetical protein